MSINSYAQNFEDVMLWRALGDIKKGCYIDIGAQHPVMDSVSKAFYEHGWRGIHLEATPAYAALLRQDRPDELVIQAAVTDQHGVITLYEIPETGISTGDKTIANGHRERGFGIKEISVPCVALESIFTLASGREIHWLKIDVEGMENQVLNSWGSAVSRPWIVVVESTLPLTQTESYDHWQDKLLNRGYQFVYFDGLNRFYISKVHPELVSAFKTGPNVFDGFTLNGTASTPFCQRLNEAHREAEESLRQQVAHIQNESIRLGQALAEQKKSFDQQCLTTEQAALNQGKTFNEKELSLVRQWHSALEELAQLRERSSEKEIALTLLLNQASQKSQQEAELHLRQAIRREQEFTAQCERLARAEHQFQLQSQHEVQRAAWTNQEKTLHQEITYLGSEVQALRHANELQTQKHGFVLDAHLGEHQRLLKDYAAFESRLKAEIMAEQQTNMRLRQVIAEVRHTLAETYSSLTWRLTAPLRALFFWFTPKRSTVVISSTIEDLAAPSVTLPPVSHLSSTTNSSFSPEPIMFPTSTAYPGIPNTAASTLNELLAYHDQSFVVCAYLTLLGRAPDPEGLNYYLGRLRTGIPKIQLVTQLCLSKEGQTHEVNLAGLEAAIHRYQRGRYPVIGGLFKLRDGSEGNQPIERKLRAIENQLFVLSHESNRRFDQLEKVLAGLHQLVEQQKKSIVTTQGRAPIETPVSADIILNSPLALERLKQLSPRARDIYDQIKLRAAQYLRRDA